MAISHEARKLLGTPEPVEPMGIIEFESIRLRLGVEGHPYPMTRMAQALGYKDTTSFYRWIREGKEEIPGPAAKLMRLFDKLGYVF